MKHVEDMDLFPENPPRRGTRVQETAYPYRCSKCGDRVVAFLQIASGRCHCGGMYKSEEVAPNGS